jgi:hypothetical protein
MTEAGSGVGIADESVVADMVCVEGTEESVRTDTSGFIGWNAYHSAEPCGRRALFDSLGVGGRLCGETAGGRASPHLQSTPAADATAAGELGHTAHSSTHELS